MRFFSIFKNIRIIVAIAILLLVALIILCVRCSNNYKVSEEIDTIDEKNEHLETCDFYDSINPEQYPNLVSVDSRADFSTDFSKISNLYEKSKYVVRGKVESVYYLEDNAIPKTVYFFQISDCIYGNLEIGQTIKVSETNGYVTMKKYVEKYGTNHFSEEQLNNEDNTVIRMYLDGCPEMKECEEYIMFLSNQKHNNYIGEYYVPIGNYKGKFKYVNSANYYERYSENGMERYTYEDLLRK